MENVRDTISSPPFPPWTWIQWQEQWQPSWDYEGKGKIITETPTWLAWASPETSLGVATSRLLEAQKSNTPSPAYTSSPKPGFIVSFWNHGPAMLVLPPDSNLASKSLTVWSVWNVNYPGQSPHSGSRLVMCCCITNHKTKWLCKLSSSSRGLQTIVLRPNLAYCLFL